MGFSITSAVLGGQMIIAYSLTIAHASYSEYYYGYSYELVRSYKYQRYSYDAKMALAAVILILGIVEFGTGIWVSICLCLMKPCCTDSQLRCWLSQTVECFWNDCGMCGISLIEHHVHTREPRRTNNYYIFVTILHVRTATRNLKGHLKSSFLNF